MNIEVRDTVFDPNLPPGAPRRVHVNNQEGKSLYKVWLYLSGYDLVYVESVTYILHPTFADPVRRVRRTVQNPNCQLVIWTWGIFDVKVTVADKSNRVHSLKPHKLTYDKELSKDIKYVYE